MTQIRRLIVIALTFAVRGPVDLAINSHRFNLGVSYTFGR